MKASLNKSTRLSLRAGSVLKIDTGKSFEKGGRNEDETFFYEINPFDSPV
jgi:hypothetical protein